MLRRIRTPGSGWRIAAVVVLLCAVGLTLGYLNKARCAGAPFDADGRSLLFDRIKDSDACYSDVQLLWIGRDINEHVFPYLYGGIDSAGELVGGSVEYPVLSGVLMWLGARDASNDAEFLANSAMLLAPFGLLTAWMLGRLAGRRALLWAIGPPIVLYAFHNWELPVVFTSVAALYAMTLERIPLRLRGIIAAILLAVGFCLKIYPGAFVLPLALFVLTGGEKPDGRYDIRGAVGVVATAATTIVAINLPFAILGYAGWRASFQFQEQREADITTNSIWYWGMRPLFGREIDSEATFQHAVSIASPALIVASFVIALWVGWRRFQVNGTYPLVAVSGAMLCGFLLFHKVHSPQYTLWLIPFLVLLAVPWPTIAGYLVFDAAIGIGIFWYFHQLADGGDGGWTAGLVQIGVWGTAALLVYFFVRFLRADQAGDAVEHKVEPEPEIATVR